MKRFLKQWVQHQQGVALIEFAMIFPFLFLLIFGGIEISRLLLIQQKLEKSGYVIADIITQYPPATRTAASGEISEAEFRTNIFPQFARIMNPYGTDTDRAVIVTSVKKINGSLRVQWQISGGGTLSGCDTSTPQVCVRSIVNGAAPRTPPDAGVQGTTATFDAATSSILATMPDGRNIIVSEAFFFYHPILQELLRDVGQAGGAGASGFRFYLQPRYYVKRTYFHPRTGEMIYLPPTYPAP